MARKIRSAELETRTARLKLPVRKKPYTARIAEGIRLAYRRNQTAGTWNVLKSDGASGSWLQKFAQADDHEDANGSTILDYWQACETARKLARGDDAGGEVQAGRPLTVSAAIDGYARALRARDGGSINATILRHHPVLLAKPVGLLTAPEVRAWRDCLPGKGLKRATANRYMKALKAWLTMAADDDDRIANRGAWKLKALEDDTKARNVVITEARVRDVVASSYKTGGKRFGLLVEVLATTGTRSSQARRLTVGDVEADHKDGPRVQMPSSRKGKGKKRISRTPLPIPQGLAERLQAEAAGRADHETLLRDDAGKVWTKEAYRKPFMVAAAAAGLPKNVTPYSLRHTSITRSLLAGIPVRLVAAAHDTSVLMIEQTYSKHVASPGADKMRAAMLDFDTPAASNVVPLARAS